MQNINALRAALANNICTVAFTKQNGELRVMRATTDSTRFVYENKTDSSTRKRNEDVTVMWDVDKAQWRSMRNDTLLQWAIEA